MQFQSLSETRLNLVRVAGPRVDVVGRRSLDQLTRHVRLFGKCFRRFQQLGSTRFIALPLCNDLVLYYWSKVLQAAEMTDLIAGDLFSRADCHSYANRWILVADSPEAVFPVRFLVQAMSLFKGSLAEWTPVRRNGTPNEHGASSRMCGESTMKIVRSVIAAIRRGRRSSTRDEIHPTKARGPRRMGGRSGRMGQCRRSRE